MTSSPETATFIDTIILNKQQKEAVIYDKGPQLVFAGAGTGKTRVLTAKIAYLIKEVNIFPNNIFAATFTNKAATQMRERVEKLVNISCSGLWIGTFHSLCARILRRDAHRLGYSPYFTIYDTSDQVSMIKKVMKELQIDDRSMQPKQLLRKISRFKNACQSFNDLDGSEKSFFEKEVIQAYGLYQKRLKEVEAMDFDDLLTNTVFLFRKNPDTLEKYRRQFAYVLVDEYQDTNTSQFELIRLLAQVHQRIFVVGDDDQSIYSWRGAQIENILSFDREFLDAKVFKLEQNYRSPQGVLDFANAIISSNKTRAKKKLWTAMESKNEVTVSRFRDDRQEALCVITKIQDLAEKSTAYGDMAILFRTNAQSRAFEDVLRKMNIQYVLVGGVSFYDRKEVKDCLAYLHLLVNPKDNISCERILNVPPRGIGAKSQEKLEDAAKEGGRSLLETILDGGSDRVAGRAKKGLEEFSTIFSLLLDLVKQNSPPQDILTEMLSISGYVEALENEETEESASRLENINELLNAIAIWNEENPDKTLSDFLEEVSLASDVDGWRQHSNSVNLMTLHSAKGLEFNTVFIVGVEDGLLPSRQNFYDDEKLEEECRLFYVGATRAMANLECSYVDTRMRFGAIMPMSPSRFIESIPSEHFRFVDQSMVYYPSGKSQTVKQKRKPKEVYTKRKKPKAPRNKQVYDEFSQETLQYRMGQIVSHIKYGQGKITSISGFGPDMQLTVLFNDGVRKRMMAKFAKLQML